MLLEIARLPVWHAEERKKKKFCRVAAISARANKAING